MRELHFSPSGVFPARVFGRRPRRGVKTRGGDDAFRPFPTSEDLLRRIATLRRSPQYANDPQLVALEAHLKDPGTLKKDTLTPEEARSFNGFLGSPRAAADVLPAISPTLLEALMKGVPFRSALGAVWRKDPRRDLIAYAPTSGPQPQPDQNFEALAPQTASAGMHIVPPTYRAHFFPVNSQSCDRCHQETQRTLWSYFADRKFDASPELAAYGRMWGSDRRFSFLPVVGTGLQPRPMQLDPNLWRAKLVEPYDPKKHPASIYIDTTKYD